MREQDVLFRPILTERANILSERLNQVVFEVNNAANKHQICDAIESTYGVRVEQVRTMVVHGKTKRRGAHLSRRSNWKKAIVTLKKGDVIDFYATE